MNLPLIVWSDDLVTGLTEVDAQHQRLIDIINRLGALHQGGKALSTLLRVLDELRAYTAYHFETEEKLMHRYSVQAGHLTAHLAAHRGFIDYLGRVSQLVGENHRLVLDNLLAFLVKWLVQHVKGADLRMAQTIASLAPGRFTDETKIRADTAHESLLETVSELYDSIGAKSLALFETNRQLQEEVARRQAIEAELDLSLSRFRSLYNFAPVALWEEDWSAVRQELDALRQSGITDVDAYFAGHPQAVRYCASLVRIRDLNAAALQQVGLKTAGELSGRLEQFMSPASLAGFAEELRAIAAGKRSYECERAFVREDGVERRAAVSLLVLPGRERELDALIVATDDITERRLTESALRSSEQRFRDLVNTTDGIVWEADATTFTFSFISDKAERLLGFPTADWLQPGFWVQRLHPDDVSWAPDYCAACTARQEPHDFEYRFIAKDGRTVWLHDIVTVVTEDGKPRWLRGIMVDISKRKQAEALLQDTRDRLHTIVDTALDAVVMIDAEGQITAWNAQATTIFGYTQSEAIGRPLHETIIPLHYRDAHLRGMQRFLASGVAGNVMNKRVEVMGLHRSGREFPIELALTATRRDDQYEFGAFIRDISEHKTQQDQLQLAYSVYAASSEAMVVTDAANLVVAVNPAFTQVTGYSSEEVLGRTPRLLLSVRNAPELYEHILERLEDTGQWQGEVWSLRKNGENSLVWLTVNTLYGPAREVLRRVGLFSDITAKKVAEETIWRQANFDALTGLPNRRLFHDRLAQQLKQAQRDAFSVALLFIDIDRFKEVNDTLGHSMGDALLVEAARRIEACIRQTDLVARLGGDEFTVLLTNIADAARIEPVVDAIIRSMAQPFSLDDQVVYVSASVGITLYPGDAEDIETLIQNADQAMYVAKESGRNGFSYFTSAMQRQAHVRLHMGNELRKALAAGQLSVHYQPIVDLATHEVCKAEALLRWHHPALGAVPPSEFIPLAENLGLINEIGDWVFREVAHWVRGRLDGGGAPLQVSINKSPRQFIVGSDGRGWIDYLAQLQLPADAINIEITEGLLLDDRDEVREKLGAFRKAGMQLSLDDFGTGYSALSYLKKFPIDYLKIDQSFVRDMSFDPSDQAIVEAIIAMAHKLGMRVIAEGIETAEQRDMLTAAGCDYGQGYLFSHPLPGADFHSWLDDSRRVN